MADPKRPGDGKPPVPPASPVDPEGATVVVPLKDLARPPAAAHSSNEPEDEEKATTTIDLKQVFGGDLKKIRAEILAQLDRKSPPAEHEAPLPPSEPPQPAAPPPRAAVKIEPPPEPDLPTTATVPAPAPLPPEPESDSPMTVVSEAPSKEEIALMKAAAQWAKAGMDRQDAREIVVPSSLQQTEVIDDRRTEPSRPAAAAEPVAGDATIVSSEPFEDRRTAPAAVPMDAGDATIVSSDAGPYPMQEPAQDAAGDATIISPGLEKELAARPPVTHPVDGDATIVQAPVVDDLKAPSKPEPPPKAAGAWPAAEPAARKPAAAAPSPPPPPAPPKQQHAAPQAAPQPAAAPASAPPVRPAARRNLLPLIAAVAIAAVAAIAILGYFLLKDYRLSEAPVTTSAAAVTPPAGETETLADAEPADTDTATDTDTGAPGEVLEVPTPPAGSTAVEKTVDDMLATVPKETVPRPIRALPPPPARQPRPEPATEQEPPPAATSAAAPAAVAAREEPSRPAKLPPLEGDLVQLNEPGVTPPQLRTEEPPKYPARARMGGAKGTVTISILVGHDGNVTAASVAKSSGNGLLDNAALIAARKTTWTPATKDGVRVRVWVSKEYVFAP